MLAEKLPISCFVIAQDEEPVYLRTPHNYHFFVDGGIAIPSSPAGYKDYWNSTLPLTLGGGGVVFSWLDINGVFSYSTYSNNHVKTKQTIGYTGIGEVEGGDFSVVVLAVTARFLGVPNGRANPYYEFGIGSFSTSFDDPSSN